MISIDQWMLFLSITFVVSASPGPLMLLTMSNGINHGYIKSLPGMLGASIGNLILVILTGLAVGLLFQLPDPVFITIKWAGVFYLLYLGGRQIFGAKTVASIATEDEFNRRASRVFTKSLLVSLSNPKGLFYFIALFPQFVVVSESIAPQFVVLTITFLMTDFLWMSIYAKGGHIINVWLSKGKHDTSVRYVSGILLFIAALILFASE